MKTIRFGTRKSALALAQTRIIMDAVKRAHPGYQLELVPIVTTGDLNMKPFSEASDKFGIKGLFTQELEEALREGRIDAAVHSLKDVPAHVAPDLPLIAYFHRDDARDALVLRNGITEDDVHTIGCSSARRRIQLQGSFNNAQIVPVRGNVETRLRKLDEGQFDALILAAAGLKRLGLEGRSEFYFSTEDLIPAPGQGILAVQGRAGQEYDDWIGALKDDKSTDSAIAERAFSARLGGGCAAPVGAYAHIWSDDSVNLELFGFFADESRGIKLYGSLTGPRTEAREVGERLAERFLKEAGLA